MAGMAALLFCLFYQVEIRYRQLPPEPTAARSRAADMRRDTMRLWQQHGRRINQIANRTFLVNASYPIVELKEPPSRSRFWPTMKPAEALHKKAQASPNSAGRRPGRSGSTGHASPASPRTRRSAAARRCSRRGWRSAFDGARGDVDDAAEFALAHAVNRRLDQHDGRQHVGVDRLLPVFDRPFAEIAVRRPAAVVDRFSSGLG